MNVRRLCSAFAVLSTLALLGTACSSKTTVITSGGAIIKFSNANPVVAGAACNLSSTVIRVSVTGDDGSEKLIADGANGATISCTYDDTAFNVVASGGGSAVTASGKFSADKRSATSVRMKFVVAGSTYTSATDTTCTIAFDAPADNALTGHIICGEIDSNKLATDVCGINQLSGSYFKFVNCNPS